MSSEPENRILARLYLDLKGPKKKRRPWIEIAKDVEQMFRRAGSLQATAARLGVSPELIRSIRSLLTLPAPVQQLIGERRIGLDAGQRLAGVEDRTAQTRIAEIIAGMSSHDARQVIAFARRNPDEDPDDFAKRVVTSKGRREKLTLLLLPVAPQLYSSLRSAATKHRKSLQQLVIADLEKLYGTAGGGTRK